MKEVAAFEDEKGRLHRTAKAAIESDFVDAIVRVWGKLPQLHNDPRLIAQALVGHVYADARYALIDALREFEEATK